MRFAASDRLATTRSGVPTGIVPGAPTATLPERMSVSPFQSWNTREAAGDDDHLPGHRWSLSSDNDEGASRPLRGRFSLPQKLRLAGVPHAPARLAGATYAPFGGRAILRSRGSAHLDDAANPGT